MRNEAWKGRGAEAANLLYTVLLLRQKVFRALLFGGTILLSLFPNSLLPVKEHQYMLKVSIADLQVNRCVYHSYHT